MAELVVQVIALVTVVLSFVFATLVVTMSQRSRPSAPLPDLESETTADVDGSPTATMARVLAQVERLAELRERGVLTDKEFTAEKTKLLRSSR